MARSNTGFRYGVGFDTYSATPVTTATGVARRV